MNKIIGYIIVAIIALILGYYILGIFGLLPDVVYNQCRNITVDQAKLRGCCEDRSSLSPVGLMFGADSCDRYRDGGGYDE